jgi:hypothetical protein
MINVIVFSFSSLKWSAGYRKFAGCLFYDPVFMGIALKPWNVGMGFIVAVWVCWSLPVYFIRRNRRLVTQFRAIFWQVYVPHDGITGRIIYL